MRVLSKFLVWVFSIVYLLVVSGFSLKYNTIILGQGTVIKGIRVIDWKCG